MMFHSHLMQYQRALLAGDHDKEQLELESKYMPIIVLVLFLWDWLDLIVWIFWGSMRDRGEVG